MAPYQFGGVETGGRNHIAPSSMKHVRRHYCRGGLNRRRPCGSFFLQAQMAEVLLMALEVMGREDKAFGLEINWNKTRFRPPRTVSTTRYFQRLHVMPQEFSICGFPTWAMSVPWRSGKELCNRPETQTEFFGQAARALKDNGHWRNLWTTMNKASKCILEKTS